MNEPFFSTDYLLVINVAIARLLSNDNRILTIRIIGHFNYSESRDFRAAYSDTLKSGLDYIIDLRLTKHVDSSGLGMLLSMKKRLPNGTSILIVNCSSQTKTILHCSRLDRMFQIS